MPYKIIRFFSDNTPSRVIDSGLTLEEAQKHCRNPDTASKTCTNVLGKQRTRVKGPWFDGYSVEA